jgi:hypothetical protein
MAMNTVNIWDGALKNIIDNGTTANVTYIGEAVPGTATSDAGWRIQRVTVSGTTTTIEWGGGGSKFDQIWDNRATTVSYV